MRNLCVDTSGGRGEGKRKILYKNQKELKTIMNVEKENELKC